MSLLYKVVKVELAPRLFNSFNLVHVYSEQGERE